MVQKPIEVPEEFDYKEIIEYCQKKKKTRTYNDLLIYPVKTTYKEFEAVRIIFVIKELNSGKVKNVDRIISLVSNIEWALVNKDQLRQTRDNVAVYIDVIKSLKEVD